MASAAWSVLVGEGEQASIQQNTFWYNQKEACRVTDEDLDWIEQGVRDENIEWLRLTTK
jgi:hypothetical protein